MPTEHGPQVGRAADPDLPGHVDAGAAGNCAKAMELVLGVLPPEIDDPVPDAVRAERGLIPFRDA